MELVNKLKRSSNNDDNLKEYTEAIEHVKQVKKSLTTWTTKVQKFITPFDGKAIINSFMGYSDALAEGEYKEHIDDAANRAGSMFRLLQEEQIKLTQTISETFEQPATEFIGQEITECFNSLTQLERANDTCKSANKKLNMATKKNSPKMGEIQQEYNIAYSKYEQQRDLFNLYFSKAKEKHSHFTLELLNNLVSAYTDYFKRISLYLESFELDIFRSNNQIATRKQEYGYKYIKEIPSGGSGNLGASQHIQEPMHSSSAGNITRSRAATAVLRAQDSITNHMIPERMAKGRKRSVSSDARYAILLRTLEEEKAFVSKLHKIIHIKLLLGKDDRIKEEIDLQVLFGNIEDISKIHSQIFKELQDIVNNWSPGKSISGFFEEQVKSLFDVYSVYSNNFHNANSILHSTCNSKHFKHLLKQFEHTGGEKLAKLLLAPLDRISQYSTILDNLVIETKVSTGDKPKLIDIALMFRQIVDVTAAKNIQKVNEIQGKIQGIPDEVTLSEKNRVFVKEGPIAIVYVSGGSRNTKKEEYQTYLFNDIILFAKKHVPVNILAKKKSKSGLFSYLFHIELKNAFLQHDGVRAGYVLSNIKDNQYVFLATDKASSWPKAIKSVLIDAQRSKLFGLPLHCVIEQDKNPVPMIVQHSIQQLITRGANTNGIFTELGALDEFDEVKNFLDQEETFDPNIFSDISVLNIANLLLLFLKELPEPLLTFRAYNDILTATDAEECKIIIEGLPKFNQFTLEYILGYCEHLAAHPKPPLSVEQIAVTMSRYLIRQEGSFDVNHLPNFIQFVLHLIKDFDYIFGDITKERCQIDVNGKDFQNLLEEQQEKEMMNSNSSGEIKRRRKLRSKSCISAQTRFTKKIQDKQQFHNSSNNQNSLPSRTLIVSSEPSVSQVQQESPPQPVNSHNNLTSSLPSVISTSPTLSELAELIDKPNIISSSAPNTPFILSPPPTPPKHSPNLLAPTGGPPSRLSQFHYSSISHQTSAHGHPLLGFHKTTQHHRASEGDALYPRRVNITCSRCDSAILNDYFEYPEKTIYCTRCFSSLSFSCASCNQPIQSPPFLFAINKNWHMDHFNCANCKQAIADSPFFDVKGFPFCTNCFRSSTKPICKVTTIEPIHLLQ